VTRDLRAGGRLATMREWLVASGVIESPEGLLLVCNRRRDGRVDWSPPGGVIEVADGEAVLDGLTREVREETGLTVTEWAGPLWQVEAEAAGLGWRLRVEVHRAVAFEGELCVEDCDDIVVDARFVDDGERHQLLERTWRPTHEPLNAWLAERWSGSRTWRYRIEGDTRDTMTIMRL